MHDVVRSLLDRTRLPRARHSFPTRRSSDLLDHVLRCQRAVEVRGRRDHHLVTIETDVAVTAGDAGGEDPPVTSGEGIRVVVENRDAAGVPGVDLRLVEAGG